MTDQRALATHLKNHHMFPDPEAEARFQNFEDPANGLVEFHDHLHANPQSDVDEDHSDEEISQ